MKDSGYNKTSATYYILSIYIILIGPFSSSLKAEDTKTSPIIKLDTVQISEKKPPIDYPLNAPRSTTSFDRNTIDELGFNRAQDISVYVPNYNLIDAGASGIGDRSSMRGLSNTPFYTAPSIVLYVDDVPYLSSYAYMNQLVNASSIEVFRGPQGGLFGQNSYAGVINVKSRRPRNNIQSNVSIDYGNFNSLNVNSYLSGAVIKDKLYLSIGVAYSKRDGYQNNTNSITDFQDHLSGRASLIWNPNTSWEVNLSAYLQDFNDGAVRLARLFSENKTRNRNIFQTQSDELGYQNQDANDQALKISYQNNYFKMLSISTRRHTNIAVNTDLDLSSHPASFLNIHHIQQQWSQELRFQSLAESTWRWSFGLFFSNNAINTNRTVKTPLGLGLENLRIRKRNEASYAAFSQISYQGFNALRIFLDLRLDYAETKINSDLRKSDRRAIQLKDKKSVVFFSPKFTIDYALSPQTSTYISTGLAFKPGGFSPQSADSPEYTKETMWSSEIGIKSSWLNGRFNSVLAFFYYDIKDYQLEELFIPPDLTVVNAPKVKSYGAEMSFAANITSTLEIIGNFAYTQAEFSSHTDPNNKENLKGRKVPYVPVFNFNIGGIFKHPTGFYARTDLLWKGTTYFDATNSNDFSEPNYSLLSTALGYEHKYFNIRAYINNLTKTKYFTSKVPSLGIGTPGAPLTFGARVSIKF